MPFAYFHAGARVLRIVDEPDAVHQRTVACEEFKCERPSMAEATGTLVTDGLDVGAYLTGCGLDLDGPATR